MPTFTIMRDGDVLGTHVITKKLITIGRAKDNTICISNSAVSRHHVKIERQGKNYILEDNGSLNGTFVNDNQVKSMVLSGGDRIILGKYTVLFDEEGEPGTRSGEGTGTRAKDTSDGTKSKRLSTGSKTAVFVNADTSSGTAAGTETRARTKDDPDESLEIATELAGHDPFIVLLKPRGSVSGRAEKRFRGHLDGMFVGGTSNMLIDMSAVVKISDPAWKFLVQQRKAAQENGGDLKLACVGDELARHCEKLGINSDLDMHGTVEQAVKAFNKMHRK